jgi:hypothetical protein
MIPRMAALRTLIHTAPAASFAACARATTTKVIKTT